MKILAIGAHQDDNEFRVGGMAYKWAKAGLTAFVTHEYRDFTLPDSTDIPGQRIIKHYKENVFVYFAKIICKFWYVLCCF